MKIKHLIIILAVILLGTGCSTKVIVEKRKYNKGYHIDLLGKKDLTETIKSQDQPVYYHDQAANEVNPAETLYATETSVENASELTPVTIEAISEVKEVNNERIGGLAKADLFLTKITENIESKVIANSPQHKLVDRVIEKATAKIQNAEGGKQEVWGVLALICGILALLISLSMISINPQSIVNGWYGSFVYSILAFAFGLTGMKRFKKNEGKYKGNGAAKTGFWMGLVVLVIDLALLALAIWGVISLFSSLTA